MSPESDVLNYFVPNAILSEIFSKLLALEDVCNFDSAICNKSRRPLFLKSIRSSIFMGSKEHNLSSHAILWINYRSIDIENLKCEKVSYEVAVEISRFGSSLNWLSIKDGYLTDRNMAQIVEGCPNLHTVEILHCWNLTGVSVFRIVVGCDDLQTLALNIFKDVSDVNMFSFFKRCPNLRSLDLTHKKGSWPSSTERSMINTDKIVIQVAENCPNLENLNLKSSWEITDIGIVGLAEGCPNLQTLNLSACDITDMSIISLADLCPNLLILDLSNFGETCSHITDMSLIRLAERCTDLDKLDIYGCENITDMGLQRMAEIWPPSKKLYLYGYAKSRTDMQTEIVDSIKDTIILKHPSQLLNEGY
jgi:hypothetical protein